MPTLKQVEFDFSQRGWRRWAIDQCKRFRELYVVEGARRIKLNGAEAKVLLQTIAAYDDCYLSIASLADESGISKRNVERLLKGMIQAGFLTIEKRPSECGRFPINHYVVFFSDLIDSEPKKFCPPSATPSATPSAMVAEDNKNTNKETTTTRWAVVVSILNELGVRQTRAAIDACEARGASPDEVVAFIERLRRETNHAGVIFNQVCKPTPKPQQVQPSKPKPSFEQLRTRAFLSLRSKLGRIPTEQEIEGALNNGQAIHS